MVMPLSSELEVGVHPLLLFQTVDIAQLLCQLKLETENGIKTRLPPCGFM